MSDASIPAYSLGQHAQRQSRFMPAGVAILAVLFLGVAYWNGFPLMFYDTGAYLEEGLSGAFLVERSPVYSFLLRFTGGGFSLWPVVILQSLMTATMIALVARIEAPRLTLVGLVAIGATLMALTGIGWYVGQVEPDCMTALVLLGCYLLLFRNQRLNPVARSLVILVTALSVACHPSHLGLIGGLLMLAALLKSFVFFPLRASQSQGLATATCPANAPQAEEAGLRMLQVSLLPCIAALAIAIGLILASNFALARGVFISRSGPVFVFARLIQDGIIQRLLNDTCPQSGYDLCPYRNRLPHTANAWLWGEHSLFNREGGFAQSQAQDDRMIADSLARYPVMHLKAALYDSVLQFFTFRTGDGIESQERILRPELLHDIPGQFPAFLNARQQRQKIPFESLNMIHVTVGMLSLLGLLLLLHRAAFRGRWNETALPGLVLVGLIGNAIICGTFSNPHDRYQSRILWLPALVLLLARSRDPHALEPAQEPD